MIGTESKLWKILDQASQDAGVFTRIETSTAVGIADVEYVAQPWHGWLELKTASMPRAGKPFSLHSPFTIAQCSWLVSHNAPRHFLRSWVLIGVIGARRWKQFILLPAQHTVHLIHVRKSPAHEWLLKRKGVFYSTAIQDIVASIQREKEKGI